MTAKPLYPPDIGTFFGTVGRLMNTAELAWYFLIYLLDVVFGA